MQPKNECSANSKALRIDKNVETPSSYPNMLEGFPPRVDQKEVEFVTHLFLYAKKAGIYKKMVGSPCTPYRVSDGIHLLAISSAQPSLLSNPPTIMLV